MVIWKVPKPVPPTDHGYKYSAVYVVDNERGKGDPCHLDGVEVPYAFTGVDQLIEDFIAAVAARRCYGCLPAYGQGIETVERQEHEQPSIRK